MGNIFNTLRLFNKHCEFLYLSLAIRLIRIVRYQSTRQDLWNSTEYYGSLVSRWQRYICNEYRSLFDFYGTRLSGRNKCIDTGRSITCVCIYKLVRKSIRTLGFPTFYNSIMIDSKRVPFTERNGLDISVYECRYGPLQSILCYPASSVSIPVSVVSLPVVDSRSFNKTFLQRSLLKRIIRRCARCSKRNILPKRIPSILFYRSFAR